MIEMAAIHDSSTCDADNGGQCDQCVAAYEYEAREARKVARAASEAENGLSGLQMAKTAIRQDGGHLWADRETIRAAILDTIDGGDPNMAGRIWFFYESINGMRVWNEDQATEQRFDFVDAVIARILELQQLPFNFPRMEQPCDKSANTEQPRRSDSNGSGS